MPDFKRLIRENLPLPPMRGRREEKIIEELACQLQDLYRESLSKGMEEGEALSHAIAQIPDWETFASDITVSQRPNLHRINPDRVEGIEASLRGRKGIWVLLADVGQDMRYALRTLRRRPVFLLAMILTLALGIGANTAIYSVTHSVLLRPFPFPEPDRLVTVWTPRVGYGFNPLSAPDYTDFRERSDVFERWGGYTSQMVNLSRGDSPLRVQSFACTADVIPALGVQPAQGRLFTEEETEAGAGQVVVLGHQLWKSRYGADPSIVGREIVIDKESRTVIGLMPEGFRFPRWANLIEPGLLLPLTVDPEYPDRGSYFLFAVGRLRDGISLESADSAMKTIAAQLEQEYPESNSQRTARVVPLRDIVLGDTASRLWPLMGATGLILLIGCLNVAGLLMARGGSRTMEAALRAALGAGRGRLVRQMLTESCLIALMGGGVGLMLAWWGIEFMRKSIPVNLPRLGEIQLDLPVLLFTLVVTISSGILFGIFPALAGSKINPGPTLQPNTRTESVGTRWSRSLGVLIVGQLALTFVLANGAFLMLRSLWNVTGSQELHQPDKVLLAGYTPDAPDRDWIIEGDPFLKDLVDRLQSIPGVEAAGAGGRLPFQQQGWAGNILAEGEIHDPDVDRPTTYFNCVTAGWFEAMGITLLQGRTFEPEDEEEGSLGIIVNRAFVEISWPGESGIGKKVSSDDKEPWFDAVVVGVVENVRQIGLERDILREIYFPFFPSFARDRWVAMRTHGDPLALVPSLRRELGALDPDLPLSRVFTGADLYDSASAGRRFNTILIGLFAIIASCLIAAGISGVMAYQVTQRTQEVGIRIALGANQGRVFGMVMTRSFILVIIGVLFGLAGAVASARIMDNLLFGVGSLNPFSLAGVSLFLLLITFAATLAPALRAVRTDPMQAIRTE